MKLLCKCGKCLTEDLYQINPKYNKDGRTTNNRMFNKGTKEIIEYTNLKGEKCEDVWYERGKFKKGIFVNFRAFKENWNRSEHDISGYMIVLKKPKRIGVSPKSIIKGIIPTFKSGYGCCNWSGGQELYCPDCNNLLGYMFLDCYEDQVVEFLDKSVIRYYGEIK